MKIMLPHFVTHQSSIDNSKMYIYQVSVDGRIYQGSQYSVEPKYRRKSIFLWYQDFSEGKNIQVGIGKQVSDSKEAKQYIKDNLKFLQTGII